MNLDDPTALRSLSAVLQWSAITLVFCGGCLQVLKHVIDLREKRVSTALAVSREQAQQRREAELRAKLDASHKQIQELAPRTITLEQRRILLDVLDKIGPHSIRIIVSGTDAEASHFAVMLRRVFVDAGWDISEVGGALFSGPPLVGIHLRVGQNPAPDYLWIIHDTLKSLGFVVQGSVANDLKGTDTVQIVIGGKPQ